MGIVYGANDTRLNRPVALKMILDPGNDEDSRKRFLREAQVAARVTHPNICRIYDIGEVDSRPFLVNRCRIAWGEGRCPWPKRCRLR